MKLLFSLTKIGKTKVKCEQYWPAKVNTKTKFEQMQIKFVAEEGVVTEDGETSNDLILRRFEVTNMNAGNLIK